MIRAMFTLALLLAMSSAWAIVCVVAFPTPLDLLISMIGGAFIGWNSHDWAGAILGDNR